MENRNQFFMNSQGEQVISTSKTFIAGVFSWMFAALLITSLAAYLFGTSPELMSLLYSETGLSGLGYVVMFAPLGLVMLLGFGINKMSFSTMSMVYILYSAVTGISLSFILLAFTSESIFKTFLITSAMFGSMAVLGYTTKMDLTRFGSILYMFLIGLIIASLVNFFMHSSAMSYIIDLAGILIFTGLTAYDMQKIKKIGENAVIGEESTKKMMLMGALNLYLDFINMFLFLLRLFGSRR
jgi:hypothetical protein